MSSFFNNCKSIESRRAFLNFIYEKSRANRIPIEEYSRYLLSDECIDDMDSIIEGVFELSVPVRKTAVIGGKRRQIYWYSERETILLSFFNYQLHCYDKCFIDNLHSGILGRQVKAIPIKIRSHHGISNCYCYRTDIHSYGASIDRDLIIKTLKDFINDDPELLAFLIKYVSGNKCIENGVEYYDAEAVKMGAPLTAFFENLYLNKIDHLMNRKAELYIRYCDDIIIYDNSLSHLSELRELFLNETAKLKLEINPKHDNIYAPGEFVDYIGFTIAGNRQQLPAFTVIQAKNLVRANCKRILHLRRKYNLGATNAMILMAQSNNKILREIKAHFKDITETDRLKYLDKYMIDSMRIVGLGKFTNSKIKYRIMYDEIKACGYTSIVNEYYKYRKHHASNTEIN